MLPNTPFAHRLVCLAEFPVRVPRPGDAELYLKQFQRIFEGLPDAAMNRWEAWSRAASQKPEEKPVPWAMLMPPSTESNSALTAFEQRLAAPLPVNLHTLYNLSSKWVLWQVDWPYCPLTFLSAMEMLQTAEASRKNDPWYPAAEPWRCFRLVNGYRGLWLPAGATGSEEWQVFDYSEHCSSAPDGAVESFLEQGHPAFQVLGSFDTWFKGLLDKAETIVRQA